MPRYHSTVAYVEPNYEYSAFTGIIGDGTIYDRAPDLEDYCIALDIIAEVRGRNRTVEETTGDKTVLVMSYRADNGEVGKVNFMSGSKIGGFDRNKNDRIKNSGPNVMTTYYADMDITDLVDYGTTELIGIKSVDIEYNSTFVPVITVKFTDVRGLSLFQPEELNHDISFNGIRGFSQDNIAQSFFHAFFDLPLPKFTIKLKGFYGDPVTYEVMCDKFDTSFNSNTGDFDVTARFIGFAYSFMADVSMNALLAAPYSDYIGAQYWSSRNFKLKDKNGLDVAMPKLYEIRKQIVTLVNDSDKELQESTESNEEKTHELEIADLTAIKEIYRKWYETLYTIVSTKYGKDFCFLFTGNNGEYKRIVILTNGKNIDSSNLAKEYEQYDDTFKKINGDLYNAIEKYNTSYTKYRNLKNVSIDFSEYSKTKTFKPVWFNDKENKFVFDGFHNNNILPRRETLNTIFGTTEEGQQKMLRKIYHDGKDEYIDAFVIEVDYYDIEKRISTLTADAKRRASAEGKIEDRRKLLNIHLYEKMGWYPSVENFMKIIMAHLETLMAMMDAVVKDTRTRTAEQLGITVGKDENGSDVNVMDEIVPPFPRITKSVTDPEGYVKVQDEWVGNFKNGIGFREVDMINGLFNGVAEIGRMEEEIAEFLKQLNDDQNNSQVTIDETSTASVPMPICPADFIVDGNVFGTESDISNDIGAFAGKIAMRAFNVTTLNFFRKEYKESWVSEEMLRCLGVVDGYNFSKLVNFTNINLFEAISENGALKNADAILSVVTGGGDSCVPTDKLPWSNDKNTPLFTNDKFWLERYKSSESTMYRCVYPVQNPSFTGLEEAFKVVEGNKLPLENKDVMVSGSINLTDVDLKKIFVNKNNVTMFNTIAIKENCIGINEIFNNAQANECEEYKTVCETMKTIAYGGDGFLEGVVPEDCIGVCKCLGSDKLSTYIEGRPNLLNYNAESRINKTLYGDNWRGDEKMEGYNYESIGLASNLEEYIKEMQTGAITNYVITESFGFKFEKGKGYKIDKFKSVFTSPGYYGYSTLRNGWSNGYGTLVPANYVKAAFFLWGIDAIDYTAIAKQMAVANTGTEKGINKAFSYMPKLAVLQIGSVMAYYCSRADFTNVNMTESDLRGILPITDKFFDNMLPVVTNISSFGKIALAKYFMNWCSQNCSRIEQLEPRVYKSRYTDKASKWPDDKYKTGYYLNEKWSEKLIKESPAFLSYDDETAVPNLQKLRVESNPNYEKFVVDLKKEKNLNECMAARILFREDSEPIKELSADLLKMVCVMNLTISASNNDIDRVNADKGRYDGVEHYRKLTYGLDTSKVKIYLNAFLDTVRKIKGLVKPGNDPTVIAQNPTNTNEDMKIELYRYLKQLYDKWYASTEFKDWMYDNFFNEYASGGTSMVGNNFYFIDSFYNKIGDKLLISPMILAKKIALLISYIDVNSMMYSFISEVLAEHRCMIKCVQNFKLLSNGIRNIFHPIPYNEMSSVKSRPDFVIIYAYEASRNLNVKNGKFMDDGFMLSDEEETPLPIRSRGDSDNFYKIPAFGVAYGRQYQNYFKNVNVNMEHPVMTEQAIIAKHNILAASRNTTRTIKGSTAQDLYDIYANQSYTCVVEMMGCAFVQPLMYFVLLNVPFFRGSYLISKVRHRMTPGDMTTEITGVRMSRICNKLVSDIFSDEDSASTFTDVSSYEYSEDNTCTDCDYKEYPVGENITTGTKAKVDDNMLEKAVTVIMPYLIRQGCNEALAAGIAGNMSVESTTKDGGPFDHKALNPNDKNSSSNFMSGGLCQWRGENLMHLINNTPNKHGRPAENSADLAEYTGTTIGSDRYNKVKSKLPALEDQIRYLVETLKAAPKSYIAGHMTFAKFNSIGNSEEAAKSFRQYYENSKNPEPVRWERANTFYEEYVKRQGQTGKKQEESKAHDPSTFRRDFFNAVQRTADSSLASSGRLSMVENSSGTITITRDDKNGEKLSFVFEIILTTGYYNYTEGLFWHYNSSPTESPTAIEVRVKEKVEASNREVKLYSANEGFNVTITDRDIDSKQLHETFVRAIVKRYGNDKQTFDEECTQFKNTTGVLAGSKNEKPAVTPVPCPAKPKPAPAKGGGGSSKQSRPTPARQVNPPSSANRTKYTGKIDDFSNLVCNPNMKKVLSDVNHIDSETVMNKRKKRGEKLTSSKNLEILYNDYYGGCTAGPSTWYNRAVPGLLSSVEWWRGGTTNRGKDCSANGVDDSTFECNAPYMEAKGFSLVWHGSRDEAIAQVNNDTTTWTNFTTKTTDHLKPGDVCTIHVIRVSGEKSSHGAMWTGKDWRSDAIQRGIWIYGNGRGKQDNISPKTTPKGTSFPRGNYSVNIWRRMDWQSC